ncbi:MAG: transglutaminase domain-containing protein, partial [Frankia sp.]|nr:transglutaminase domain-containing protein [Frankia sp.]
NWPGWRAGGDPAGGQPSRLLVGPLAVGLPVAALVVLLSVVAGVAAPIDPADRFDPREHSRPPVDDIALLNPLVRVRTQLETQEPVGLFTVRAAPQIDIWPAEAWPAGTAPRLRIAALGDFDGASWRNDGDYVAVDRVLPRPDDQPEPTVELLDVHLEVTFDDYDEVMLPTVGQPTTIELAGVRGDERRGPAFDPAAGAVAVLAPPRADSHLTLTTQVPVPAEERLASATVATGAAADAFRVLPNLPADLRAQLLALARRVTDGQTTAYAKLVALADYLRDARRFPYDLGATPGHSYARLIGLLAGADQVAHRGYAEQHAAAFAVLARSLGFPARVSVGYLLPERATTADGALEVTSHHAHAWPEVLFDGIGWVAFEPTDTSDLTRSISREPPPSAATPESATEGDEGQNPAVIAPERRRLLPGAGADDGGLGWPYLLLIGLGAAALAAPLLVAAEKTRRRVTRRHRGGPGDQVLGAWWEARDRLGEVGVPRSAALTGQELVRAVAAQPRTAPAAGPLRQLAALTDEVVFGVDGPRGGDPARAWALVGEIRAALRPAMGWSGRVRALLDPRTLARPPAGAPVAAVAAGSPDDLASVPAAGAAPAAPTDPAQVPGPQAGPPMAGAAAAPTAPGGPADFLAHWYWSRGRPQRESGRGFADPG